MIPSAAAWGGPSALPDAVVDSAIHWSVKLDYGEPDAATWQAFENWLRADPLHAQAWLRMGALKGELRALPGPLAQRTLQQAGRGGRRRAVKLLAAGAGVLTAGWLVRAHTPWQRLGADASTGVGEQRTLQLADGSIVVLNTDTALGLSLDDARRVLVLRRGEVLVTTGADAAAMAHRPFWVHTPQGTLQALGTRFVVRLEEGRTRVTVQEGAVALHPAQEGAGAAPAAVARAGDSLWLWPDRAAPAPTRGFAEDGWAEGVLAGQDIRLDALLAELERYRHGRIVCDPAVAGLRVSGVFHLRHSEQVLQFLVQTQPLQVQRRTRFWVRVGPADTGA